jgi:hypothetical protein
MKAKCVLVISLLLLCFAAFADESASGNSEGSDDAASVVVGLLILLVLASVPVSLIGAFLAMKGKLIVYYGKSDLNMTYWIALLIVITGIGFAFVKWLGVVASLLVFYILFLSFKKSYRANKTLFKTMMAIATKYSLLAFMLLCGLLALFGAVAAVDAVKNKKTKNAIEGAAVAAGAGLTFHKLNKMMHLLVKEEELHQPRRRRR